jgi:hypothetical protein
MKRSKLFILILLMLACFSCVPLEKISRHDFDSGYYKMKSSCCKPSDVYIDLVEDSIIVYKVTGEGKTKAPELSSAQGIRFSQIDNSSFLHESSFIKNSIDLDLSTVILKYRPSYSGVPNQLSSNINAVIYFGLRRDFYRVKSNISPLKKVSSNLRHIGFDAGFLAGFGITPVNPTVTNSKLVQEYDGFYFQKGLALFFTIDRMSVGLALGFDNLLDENSHIWIYNQKPWIGIVLGIANF